MMGGRAGATLPGNPVATRQLQNFLARDLAVGSAHADSFSFLD
jgi:hypothetical protein